MEEFFERKPVNFCKDPLCRETLKRMPHNHIIRSCKFHRICTQNLDRGEFYVTEDNIKMIPFPVDEL